MKAQQLVQCMIPRALFGGVRNTSKSVYTSDSQLLLSRPSVSGAYLRSTQEKQLLGYQFYCFQYVAAALLFNMGITYTISSMLQLMFFIILVTVVLFPVLASVCFFSRHGIISHDRIYEEQKESIGGQILLNAKTIR